MYLTFALSRYSGFRNLTWTAFCLLRRIWWSTSSSSNFISPTYDAWLRQAAMVSEGFKQCVSQWSTPWAITPFNQQIVWMCCATCCTAAAQPQMEGSLRDGTQRDKCLTWEQNSKLIHWFLVISWKCVEMLNLTTFRHKKVNQSGSDLSDNVKKEKST